MTNFEDVLKELNDFGIYQKLRYLLVCLASLLPPIVTYIHSFAAPRLTKNHRCKHPYFENDIYSIKYNFTGSNITSLDKCSYTLFNDTRIECKSWVFDKTYFKKTLTEEWSMVCSDSSWIGSVQTLYFSGYLVGSIITGILSDHFGRRPIMLSSFIMILIGSIGVAFGTQESFGRVPAYIIYAVSRFIIAVGTRGINVTGFILGMELMTPSRRTFAGIGVEYFFAFGQLILVSLAYLNYMVFGNNWRTLAIFVIFLVLPYLSYFIILPESPRWLLSKDRKDECLAMLKHIAKTNKTELKTETWEGLLIHHEQSKSKKSEETGLDIFKSPKLVLMSVILILNWAINNLVFYGVGLKSSDLGVNPYLSFTISATVEIISYVITQLILDRIGRKIPYLLYLFLAGVSCFSISFTNNTVIVVTLAMIGKFSISASYAIIYLYTSELFPTSVRNSGMGACSMMARIGAMTAPKINDLSIVSSYLPFLIFGITCLIGTATAVVLPETLGRSLSETIKEADRVNRFSLSCKTQTFNDEEDNSKVELHKI